MKNLKYKGGLTTLISRIIVQVGIKVQVGKILKTKKSAGWSKTVQAGIYGILSLKIKVSIENFQILINVQVGIKACRLENF